MRRARLLLLLLLACGAAPARGGVYIFAGGDLDDIVTHPSGYTGVERVLTVTVCVDPGHPSAPLMRVPVRNVLATYNALAAKSPNVLSGGANDIPSSAIDMQSVLAHEVGHCIGMAHPNAASESGLSGTDRNYTKSEQGPDVQWDLGAGVDGIKGSCDDVRADDQNLHWFNRSTNNPFVLPAVVDSTTYSRNLAHLPTSPAQCSGPGGAGLPGNAGSGPHSFAANGDRSVAARLGFPSTEAVMQQGTAVDEDQRALSADEVATLRYAMSGLDEAAGTADDYTFQLVWGGMTASGCDVVVRFDGSVGFAACSVNGGFVGDFGNPHVAIGTGTVTANPSFSWYYDQDLACSLDVDGNGIVAALTDGLLILRYLFGLDGASLVAGALGEGATRTNPDAVAAFLGGCRYPLLDADGSGSSEPLSDGLLVLRYLFGVRGAGLVAGALGAGCTRCAAPSVEDVIESLLPGA